MWFNSFCTVGVGTAAVEAINSSAIRADRPCATDTAAPRSARQLPHVAPVKYTPARNRENATDRSKRVAQSHGCYPLHSSSEHIQIARHAGSFRKAVVATDF